MDKVVDIFTNIQTPLAGVNRSTLDTNRTPKVDMQADKFCRVVRPAQDAPPLACISSLASLAPKMGSVNRKYSQSSRSTISTSKPAS